MWSAEEIAKKVYEQKHGHKPDTGSSLLKNTKNFKIFLLESYDESQRKFYENLPPENLDTLNIFSKDKPDRILAKYESLMKDHIRTSDYSRV